MNLIGAYFAGTALVLMATFKVIKNVIAPPVNLKTKLKINEAVDTLEHYDNDQHLYLQNPGPDCGSSYHCIFGEPDIRLYGAHDGTPCPCSNIDTEGFGRDSCQYTNVSIVEAVCESGRTGGVLVHFGQVNSYYYNKKGAIYVDWASGSAPGGDITKTDVPGDDLYVKCHPF